MKNFGFALLALSILSLASCADDISSKIDQQKTDDVSQLFNFSTTKTIDVSVSYKLAYEGKAMVEIFAENPYTLVNGAPVMNKDLKPIAGGFTDDKGSFSAKVTMPSAIDKIYVYSPSLEVNTHILAADITGSSVSIDEKSGYDPWILAASRASYAYKTTAEMGLISSYIGWDEYGHISYYDQLSSGALSSTVRKAIANKILTNSQENTNNEYLATRNDFYISKPMTLTMRFISTNGDDKNSLGFYCYKGNTPPTDPAELNKVVIFPCATADHYDWSFDSPMKANEAVQLKWYNPDTQEFESTFPAGYTIGFFLIDNGGATFFAGEGYSYYKKSFLYNAASEFRYSDSRFNADGKSHMAAFDIKDNGSTFRVISFEDRSGIGSSPLSGADWDYNDAIFALQSSDIDGLSEVPTATISQREYVVTTNSYGFLAFEDLWPSKGDFDLNDVVVKYNCKTTIGEDNQVIKTEDTWTLLWSGAGLDDDFGYQLDNVASSNIKSCTVTGGDYTAPGQGLVVGTQKAIVNIFNACRGIVNNTSTSSKTVTLTTVFKNRVPVADIAAPYNPFIVPHFKNEARREVHLVDFTPTELMDLSMFGKGDDVSIPSAHLYYRTSGEYPFAIQMPGVTELGAFLNEANEGVSIIKSFPYYQEWVTSKGESHRDWYTTPVRR